MKTAISRAALADLLRRADDDSNRETCGLVLGEVERVRGIIPCVNVSESPEISFEIDPASLVAAHREARNGALPPIGCYHSHPNGLGEPSRRDSESADPSLPLWLIIANGEVRAWILGEGGFAETELIAE